MWYNLTMNPSTSTTWQYLAANPNSCYKQLFVKGTRIRARVLYGMFMSADEPMTPEEIAAEFNLPLQAVQEAIAYCQANPGNCPWRPSETDWKTLAANADTGARVSRRPASGQTQTAVERDAIGRGLGLPSAAPAPSVIKMNLSPDAKVLMTAVDLAHK